MLKRSASASGMLLKLRPSRGFTILELMVTITLAGILVMLSVPAFVTWTRNTQVRTVAESLQTGLRMAQAEAQRRNRQVVMSFTNATPASGTTAVVGGKNWTLQTVAKLGDQSADYITGASMTDIASPVTITSSTAAVCFNDSGRQTTNTSGTGVAGASCTAAVTTFDVAAPSADRNLRVIVQLGGQIRICDPKRPPLSSTSPDGCP